MVNYHMTCFWADFSKVVYPYFHQLQATALLESGERRLLSLLKFVAGLGFELMTPILSVQLLSAVKMTVLVLSSPFYLNMISILSSSTGIIITD